MFRASILTLFPDLFPGPLGASLAGKALAAGLWSLDAVDIRAHATDKHRSVDDTPAGGGPGMVMRADVLARALDAVSARGRSASAPPDVAARRAADAGAHRHVGARAGRGDRVRPLRGRRPAADRGARARRNLARRFRPLRRRAGRDGADRRLRAAPPRRHGQGGLRRGGEFLRRAARISALHAPAAVRGPRHPGRAHLRRSRQDRGLAA